MQKTANVSDALPKRLQPEAKKAVHAVYNSSCRTDALDRVADFATQFSDFPKAVGRITGELDARLAFYDYPTDH